MNHESIFSSHCSRLHRAVCERGPVLFGDVHVAGSVLLEQTRLYLYKLSTPKIHYGSDSNGNNLNRLVQTVRPSVYLCVFTIEKQSDGCVWAYTGSWCNTIFRFQKKIHIAPASSSEIFNSEG